MAEAEQACRELLQTFPQSLIILNLLGDNLESGEELSNGDKNILIKKIIKNLNAVQSSTFIDSEVLYFLISVIRQNFRLRRLIQSKTFACGTLVIYNKSKVS